MLDQIAGRKIDRRVVGFIDDVGADIDELAALRELENGAAIFLGIDDGARRGGKPREIGGAADLLQRLVALEKGLERDRRGKLAGPDQCRGRLVDAGMHGLEEMLGLRGSPKRGRRRRY